MGQASIFCNFLVCLLCIIGYDEVAAVPTTAAEATALVTTIKRAREFFLEIQWARMEKSLDQCKKNSNAYTSACSSAFPNDASCSDVHDNKQCCDDDKATCKNDPNTDEEYDNARPFKCCDECLVTGEKPPYCTETSITMFNEVAAGTRVADAGWINLCPSINQGCYTCDGYTSQYQSIDETKCADNGGTWKKTTFGHDSDDNCEKKAVGGNACKKCSTDGNGLENCPSQIDTLSDKTETECGGEGGEWIMQNKHQRGTHFPGYPLNGYNADGTCVDGTCPVAQTENPLNRVYLCNEHAPTEFTFHPEGLLRHVVKESYVKDTQFYADLDADKTGADAYTAQKSYYDKLFKWEALFNLVTVTSSNAEHTKVVVDIATSGFIPLVMPKNAVNIKSSSCTDDTTCGGDGVTFLTSVDQHIFMLEPINYASSDTNVKIEFPVGKITVIGGNNAGTIDVSTTKKVRIADVINSGTVSFSNGQDVVLANITNSGAVTFSGVKGTIIDVTSTGSITVTNTKGTLWSSTNEVGGTITVDGAQSEFIIHNSYNKGTITVNNGNFTAIMNCSTGGNTGTIVLGANAVGKVQLPPACYGTITDKSNGGVEFLHTGSTDPTASPTVTTKSPTTVAPTASTSSPSTSPSTAPSTTTAAPTTSAPSTTTAAPTVNTTSPSMSPTITVATISVAKVTMEFPQVLTPKETGNLEILVCTEFSIASKTVYEELKCTAKQVDTVGRRLLAGVGYAVGVKATESTATHLKDNPPPAQIMNTIQSSVQTKAAESGIPEPTSVAAKNEDISVDSFSGVVSVTPFTATVLTVVAALVLM